MATAYRDNETINQDLNGSSDGVFIYNALFEKIKDEYGDSVYHNWFQHIKFKDLANQTLTLVAPSNFVREWIISNYFTKIYKLLEDFDNFISRINIVVENTSSTHDNLSHVTINSNNFYSPEVSINKDFSDISSNKDFF
jgi:chromosomal replication initiator protein